MDIRIHGYKLRIEDMKHKGGNLNEWSYAHAALKFALDELG